MSRGGGAGSPCRSAADGVRVLAGRLEIEAADIDLEDGFLAHSEAVQNELLLAGLDAVGHVDARSSLAEACGPGTRRRGGRENR
jgi:hypothetical protein